MTSLFRHRRIGPVTASASTAAVFIAALWVQHARQAWPFAPPDSRPAPVHALGVEPTAGSGSPHDRVPVDVTPAMLEALDVRLEAVRRESLAQTVRAIAIVVPDESRISHVHTRVSGWVEELHVNTTGEMVIAGQPLARIFSQELLSSQTEYLAARRTTAALGVTSAVVASGRTRLGVLGMTPAEIDMIEHTGEPMQLVTVVAPRSGVVVNRGVTVGTAVDPSTTLLTIADLSRVWVLAEVPEASIPAVRLGTTVQLEFPASSRPPFAAPVDFIYPTLSERTRTLRVRMSAANPHGALRPGLYGTASFESSGRPTMTVSRDAVVDTGRQQHVFVAVGDRFEPRPVTLGVRLTDRVEILDGLDDGDRIVTAGVFLLDSESRLRATGGAGGHGHGAPATGTQDRAAAPANSLPVLQSALPGEAPDPDAGHQPQAVPRTGAHDGHRE